MDKIVNTAPEKTRQSRFVTLDAMRGVAALIVVLFHTSVFNGPYRARFGYLAVDLFFVISGFVLAKRYDEDFANGLDPFQFMWKRWLRLAPLLLIGLALGLLTFNLPEVRNRLTEVDLAVSVALNVAMLPSFTWTKAPELFPGDWAGWSLLLEFWVANLAFAFLWRQLRGLALVLLIVVAGAALILCEKLFYTIDLGADWHHVGGGVPRVVFSFFAGVALSRLHAVSSLSIRPPSWSLLLVMVAALLLPLDRRAAHVFELTCVLALFPALVFLGAGALEKYPRVGRELGDASYAAYTIHFPVLILCAHYLTLPPSLITQVGLVVVVIPASWSIARLDLWARTWRHRKRPPPSPA